MTATKAPDHVQQMRKLGACKDAIAYAGKFSTSQAAWDACKRGDWMLWAIGRTTNCEPWSEGRKRLVACCLDCAETVKHLWPAKHRDAIATNVAVMRKWIEGRESAEQAQTARLSLWEIYRRTAADAAHTVYAAAHAGADADTAADAAAYAHTAADAAAYTHAAANAAANAHAYARWKNRLQTASIVRQHYPHPPE